MFPVAKRSVTPSTIRQLNKCPRKSNSGIDITLKKSGAYLLRARNTEAFRKPFPGHVLCGLELNVAERLSWISENCAQTKAEKHWKLSRHLWTLNQKINSLDSQDRFMEDQIKCLPGKQTDSPAEGPSLGKCRDDVLTCTILCRFQ